MSNDVVDAYGISQQRLVDWTQSFVRHPSPQTELFESEPQIQSFIGDTVVPLVKELELPFRRDRDGQSHRRDRPRARRSKPHADGLCHDASREPDEISVRRRAHRERRNALHPRAGRVGTEGIACRRAWSREGRRDDAEAERQAHLHGEHGR